MQILLRLGLYAFLAFMTLLTTAFLLTQLAGQLMGSVLSYLLAALVANFVAGRLDERTSWAQFGLPANGQVRRQLLLGLLGGAGAALLAVGVPLLLGLARLEADPQQPASGAAFLYVTLALAIGAFEEELLFRGYAFQVLRERGGTLAALLLMGLVFGYTHLGNLHASALSTANTCLWGLLLGWAYVRGQALWVPIGIHFGWNWTLPLLGVPVSGFTIGTTGYTLHWRWSDVWSGGAYGPEGGLVTLLVLPLLALYVWKAPLLLAASTAVRPSPP